MHADTQDVSLIGCAGSSESWVVRIVGSSILTGVDSSNRIAVDAKDLAIQTALPSTCEVVEANQQVVFAAVIERGVKDKLIRFGCGVVESHGA